MMEINLNIKIKGGKRTPIEVNVYRTSVNEKSIEFANGKQIKESTIIAWIKKYLTHSLKLIQEE
jgi:hypothetical protein